MMFASGVCFLAIISLLRAMAPQKTPFSSVTKMVEMLSLLSACFMREVIAFETSQELSMLTKFELIRLPNSTSEYELTVLSFFG